MNRGLVTRSPIASLLVGVSIFGALSSWSYFALGGVALLAGATALVFYLRPNLSPIVLTLLLGFPVYSIFFSSSSPALFLVGAMAAGLLVIALISSTEDWPGALTGLWLGLALAVPAMAFLVLPLGALVALYRGPRSASVAFRVFVLFGIFFLVAPQLGFPIPGSFSASASMFFPSLATLASLPSFASLFAFLLGPGWSGSLQTSVIGMLFEYIPVFFILVAAVVVVLVHYGRRLAPLIPVNRRLAEISIVSVVSLAAGVVLFSSPVLSAATFLTTIALAVAYNAAGPLFARRPKLELTGLTRLFQINEAAVTQAQRFGETEGLFIQDRARRSSSTQEYWDKTVGVDDVKQNLIKSVALPIKNKKEATKFGVKPAKGVLLYGPPGTGKSTLLRGLASTLGMKYIEVSPGEILSKWYGESEQRMQKVFDEAMADPPCILAVDEIDSIGKERGSYAGDDVTPRVLNLMLIGMDRIFQSDVDVVVVATTNKPQMLDRALLRPGRFDNIVYMGPPDEKARAEIFRRYLGGKNVVATNIDYDRLAKISERFTGADIEGVVTKVLADAFYERTGKKGTGPASPGEAPVTQKVLEDAIASTRPTLTFSMLQEYEAFKVEFQRERRIQKGWESEIPNVKFDEIGDMEAVKAEMREAFEVPLTKPDLMEKLKIRPVKGVLLYGPPGNGKTLLAKAVATEISANFFVVSGADLAKGSPGQSASKIKEVFGVAKDNAPAIIFIDEIDQIAPDRSNPMGAAFVPVTTQLLSELDGVRELKGVMVLAATNRPEQIDAALLRANRLEKHIEVPYPGQAARKEILGLCLKGVKVDGDVSLEKLASSTDGFSGADLQELVNEAKKSVLRRSLKGDEKDSISARDFGEALEAKKRSAIRK